MDNEKLEENKKERDLLFKLFSTEEEEPVKKEEPAEDGYKVKIICPKCNKTLLKLANESVYLPMLDMYDYYIEDDVSCVECLRAIKKYIDKTRQLRWFRGGYNG